MIAGNRNGPSVEREINHHQGQREHQWDDGDLARCAGSHDHSRVPRLQPTMEGPRAVAPPFSELRVDRLAAVAVVSAAGGTYTAAGRPEVADVIESICQSSTSAEDEVRQLEQVVPELDPGTAG